MLLRNLAIGLATMVACLLLQALLIIAAERFYRRHHFRLGARSFGATLWLTAGVMLILIAGNLVQIGVWALLFVLLREFERFPDAFYHSAVNFASLGYGDIVMSAEHRLLGALEAVNGVLMIGVSTAALSVVFQDAMRGPSSASRTR